MEMVENLADACASAFEKGQIVGLQLDLYEAIPLPGFEEMHEEMKRPRPSEEA
jgi:hypothetical protein